MKLLSVGFENQVYDKIKKGATDRGISLNSYIRKLVDTSLELEKHKDMPAKGRKEEDLLGPLNHLKTISEKGLISIKEIEYLMRYLVGHSPRKNKVSHHDDVLKEAQEKAEFFAFKLNKEAHLLEN